MTVNELALIMARERGERQDDPNFVAMAENWIKGAIKVIAIQSNWRFFLNDDFNFDTVALQKEYTMPEDFRYAKFFQLTVLNKEITYRDPARLPGFREDLDKVSSEPRHWWFVENKVTGGKSFKQIRIFPVVNAILNITAPYYYHPVSMTGSSVIPLDESFLEIIQSYARSKMLRQEKNYAGSDREMKDFEFFLGAALSLDRSKPGDNITMIETDLPRNTGKPLGRLRYKWEN